MKEVKRYDSYGYDGLIGLMKEHADGDWVRSEEFDALRAENAELAETLGAVRGSIEGLITLWFATREHGCLPVAVIKATAAVKIIDAALATTTSMEQSHE